MVYFSFTYVFKKKELYTMDAIYHLRDPFYIEKGLVVEFLFLKA